VTEDPSAPPSVPPAALPVDTPVPEEDIADLARRTVAMVAEALVRFELLLTQNEHRFNDHEALIASSIRKTSKELVGKMSLTVRLLKIEGDSRHYRSILSQARNMYWALREPHRSLRHLSVPNVLPESTQFINFAWNALLQQNPSVNGKEMLPTSLALCLSSDLMQPSAHPVQELSVVALSKLDSGNALGWPLLLHELGHNAIREIEFHVADGRPPEGTQRVHNAWLLEMACDLIGLRMAGPAYLVPFIMQTLLEKSFLGATTKHPSPFSRANFLLAQTTSWGSQPSVWLADLRKLVNALESIQRPIHEQLMKTNLAGSTMICFHCGSHLNTIQISSIADLPLTEFVKEFDKKLPLTEYSAASYPTSQRIAESLGDGVLAGSSHDGTEAAAEFEAFRGAGEDTRIAAFKRAQRSVCDVPNDIFSIITAGWIRQFNTSVKRLTEVLVRSTDNFDRQWALFTARVESDDALLRGSVESALFHSELRRMEATDAER